MKCSYEWTKRDSESSKFLERDRESLWNEKIDVFLTFVVETEEDNKIKKI